MAGTRPTCALRGLMASAALAVAAASPASAQVLQIGDGGEVVTYDRPSVFTASGAEPIQPKARAGVASAGEVALPSASPVVSAATAAELSPDLVEAVAWTESRGRAGAVSKAGAIGEMQLMPGTARGLGVNPRDSADNYKGGAAYLGGLMRRYDGDLQRALAAYNAGPGAVDRYGGVPPYRETRAYVGAVLDRLSRTVAPEPGKKGL